MNGDSTVGTLRAAGLGGEVIAWRDALTEGPVPRLPLAELRARRALFLADCGWTDRRSIEDELEDRDRLVSDALTEARRIVLWFEHDL